MCTPLGGWLRAGSKTWLASSVSACLTLSTMLYPTDARAEEAMAEGSIELPALDEGIASFGAAVAGDALYVYGGHIGRTHQHSVDNLSHHFRRLDLENPATGWQDLGEVRGLQGLAMVAHDGRVCRIGGLDARNAKGEDEDLVSIAEAACYDPARGTWSELPPLPAGRSSHDAAVLGDVIYVAGGWQLRGLGNEAVWHRDMLALDLSAEEPAWRSIDQPFERRALAMAVAGGEVHVFGGLGADGTSLRVEIYDPASGAWSEGPELPLDDGPMRGFGVSAFGFGDRVLLSGGDGVIHALEAGGEHWREVGQLEQPRFFHRLLPHGDSVLFVGGAHRKGHLGDTEVLALASLRPRTGVESVAAVELSGEEQRWPAFRGAGDDRAPSAELPLRWSPEKGVVWRAELPGYGQSSPIVWDGQVFVTSIEGEEKETLILSAFELGSGEVRWRRRFEASLRFAHTDTASRAAPTPAVDGERVYAFWESGDLVALDHDGETLWRRSLSEDYGAFAGNHGIASSPVLADDLVIVQVTHDGPSYFVALEKATGEVRWKADRPAGVAWTTPILARGTEGLELISSAAGRVEALDAATGERLWQVEGIEKNHVPSAAVDGDVVVVASSAASHNFALRRGSDGAEVIWRAEGVSSGFGSPVVHDGCVLFINKAGVVTCVGESDGEVRWKHRLPDATWATPIVAGERVYFFTKKGETVVLRHDEESSEVVAENSLPTDDTVYGVAAVRDAFVVRTGGELLRIGPEQIELARR